MFLNKRDRIPQAPSNPMPELEEFLSPFWQGFHRNAVLVMLSSSFLVWPEWRQRQPHRRRGPKGGGHFPPRPDRRRRSLPAIHRQISEWLRLEALCELIALDLIEQLRPMLN